MRLYLKLTPNDKPVSLNYQVYLVGAFHKWLGINNIHNGLSLYSFSWLHGGKININFLDFPKGAYWFISSYDTEIVKKLIKGIKKYPEINYGLKITDIVIKDAPKFNDTERFLVASPVFIKRTIGTNIKHFLYTDMESDSMMTQTLNSKMKLVGLKDETLKISFDRTYRKANTKLVNYKGINNKASMCPLIIKGKPETKAFAWNVGVGNSTGIGFGSLI